MKDTHVQARVNSRQKEQLAKLQKLTGMSQSEVLRSLIDNSDLAPVSLPVSRLTATSPDVRLHTHAAA